MTPSPELRTRLRKLLDERVPEGGSCADTRFTDDDLDELLTEAQTVYGAAALGWTQKAGMYQAEMGDVETTRTGQEDYKLTALRDRQRYALQQAEAYAAMDRPKGAGSRIMAVSRPGVL